MDNFIKSKGGSYYAPLKRWILTGRFIPVNRLRVISTCFAQGGCPGSSQRAANARARLAHIANVRHGARGHHGMVAEMRFAGAS
jgi:hypothetical protein